VPDVDPLRARFDATRTHQAMPSWSSVQRRATDAGRRNGRRQRIVIVLVAIGAVALLLPSPGLGRQLLDVITDRPARPALERYLDGIGPRPGIGQIDIPAARELIDTPSARGPLTLFRAPSSADNDCLGLFAQWLADPGISCGFRDTPSALLGASLIARVDPRVLAIIGTAPAAATRVRLSTPGGDTSSQVEHGYFLVVFDPSVFTDTPTVTVTAIDGQGGEISTQPVDLAAYYDPRCDQRAPGRIVAAAGNSIELHEARTVHQRCYWVEEGGEPAGGIWTEPLQGHVYDPSTEPAIIVRTVALPSGAEVLMGRAAVAATSATMHFEDGTTSTVPTPDRYLLLRFDPAERLAGHRPTGIDLLDREGDLLGHVRIDPANPGRLAWP
jgi:hypothetical protein